MSANHENPRVGNSPRETEATVRMARAMCSYRVTNSAGGTELRTRSRAAAIQKLNRLQFPGDVLMRRNSESNEVALEFELDEDGLWVEAQS